MAGGASSEDEMGLDAFFTNTAYTERRWEFGALTVHLPSPGLYACLLFISAVDQLTERVTHRPL
jgi:hypothetical protein